MIAFTLVNRSRPKATVMMLAFYCSQRYRMTIGVGLPAKYWSDKRHRAKVTSEYDGSLLNERIDAFERAAAAFLTECSRGQIIPTLSQFKAAVQKATMPQIRPESGRIEQSLTHYIESVYIPRYAPVRAESSIRGYNTVLLHLREYEERYGTVQLPEVDINFYNRFREWFFLPRKGKVYTLNYFGKMIKFIKQAVREARIVDHLHISEGITHRGFVKSQEFGASIYLTTEELRMIEDCELPTVTLRRTRDIFLIGCYTGLRVSDLLRLTGDDFSGEFLRIRTHKTSSDIVIPIHPVVRKIVDAGFDFGTNFYEQKINERIKEVGRLAGLTEPVTLHRTEGMESTPITRPKCEFITCHTARRSFATNAFKAGVPAISIMKITGHKQESTFMRYIKITEEENARLVAESAFFRGEK